MEEDLLSGKELCKYLKISLTSLYRFKKTKEFPRPFLMGVKPLWRKSEIDEYLESTRKKEVE